MTDYYEKAFRLLTFTGSFRSKLRGAFAQSGGLTDMSQSRFAKMANTELGAVHWTDAFGATVSMYIAIPPCKVCGIHGTIPMFRMASVTLK